MVEGTTDLLGLPDFSTRLSGTRELLAESGIGVLSVSTGIRFTSELESERAAQLDQARRHIDLAAELGSPYVRIFGGPIEPEMDRKATMANIEHGFRLAAEHARERGVTVLLETHDTFATGRASKELIERINHRSVGLIWDILHSYRCGETFEQTLSAIGVHVRHVHLKDSSDFDENRFDLKLCGEGRLPIPEALRLLDSIGYDGYYEFEWERGWHPQIEPPEVALPHFVRYITGLRQSLDENDRS